MNKYSGVQLGLIGGLILGTLHLGLLWLRYTFFSYNPFIFILSSFINFILLVVLLYILAIKRKKDLQGMAEIKDIFQTLFVAIIIIEVIAYLYNYVYLNHINPNFYVDYEKGLINFAHDRNLPQAQIDEKVKAIRDAAKDSSLFWAPMIGILSRIVLDSIFAVMISFLIRTRVPSEQIIAWRERNQNSLH